MDGWMGAAVLVAENLQIIVLATAVFPKIL